MVTGSSSWHSLCSGFFGGEFVSRGLCRFLLARPSSRKKFPIAQESCWNEGACLIIALICYVHSTAFRYACQQFYQTVCVLGAGVITAALVRMPILPQSSPLLVPNNPESYVLRLALESTYDTQTNPARGWPLNCGQSLVVAAHKRATTPCTTLAITPPCASQQTSLLCAVL